MKIAIYAARHGHQNVHAEAFAEGLQRHGVASERHQSPIDCDLAVFWGHRRNEVIERQRRNGARYLVMERGYIGDRFAWTSLGYDGLNGRADFCLPDCVDGARFERHHGHLMQSWSNGGGYALLMGQVPTDAALAGVDFHAWCRGAVPKIQAETGLSVMFRRHPLARIPQSVEGAMLLAGDLADALAGAALAVTYNSNSGVDAALAGIPVVAMGRGSMAWPVASHAITADALQFRPDRAQWAARLAWCQWTIDEIRSGAAWDHIKAGARRDRPEARAAAE
jgi:hypothetical protein